MQLYNLYDEFKSYVYMFKGKIPLPSWNAMEFMNMMNRNDLMGLLSYFKMKLDENVAMSNNNDKFMNGNKFKENQYM